MYLPYVRGKQFDLLALKEMAPHLAANPQILPVIEPVRARGEALIRCVDALSVADVPVTVVVNPGVGELAGGDGHSTGRTFALQFWCARDSTLATSSVRSTRARWRVAQSTWSIRSSRGRQASLI